jgi:hypothetical protein
MARMDKRQFPESAPQPRVTPKAAGNGLPPADENGERPQVNVLYTTHAGTLAALKMASRLGAELGIYPTVLRLYAVPYTLPLEMPAVAMGFLEEQIHALARESPTEVTARIILCREPRRSLPEILRPHSLIVLGGTKRWWPTKEQWWARMLRKDGHEVIFVHLE